MEASQTEEETHCNQASQPTQVTHTEGANVTIINLDLPHADLNNLYALYEERMSIQKRRIANSNRLSAIEDERSEVNPDIPQYFFDLYRELENTLDELMSDTVKEHIMWPWLECVKGIGPILAARLLAPINMDYCPHISSLWKYAGQGVTDGRGDRRTKGQLDSFNSDLKTTCSVIATSMLRGNSQYRRFYDDKKAYYLENREWTLGHCDNAAKRYMVKMFLSHLWLVWRMEIDGELEDPYVHAHENHTRIIQPWDVVPEYDYKAKVKV